MCFQLCYSLHLTGQEEKIPFEQLLLFLGWDSSTNKNHNGEVCLFLCESEPCSM